MASMPGYEPGPHWWEESALTPLGHPIPDSFPYHRTTVTDTNSSELEVERDIQAATNAFGALPPELNIYNAAVLPSLLNATEWSSRS